MTGSSRISIVLFVGLAKLSRAENDFTNSDVYCDIHSNHTLCLFQGKISPTCGEVTERGLSPEEKALVMRLHNEKRAQIANGLEMRGDPGPQPPAANMMEMTWDDELEYEAQTWTDQCVRNHECPQCRELPRFKVGQNLFWFGHFSGSWEKSVQGWYDEVQDFNSSFVFPFYVIPGILVGHYTQLAWAQNHRIGCGKLYSFPDGSRYGQQFFICNYAIAGNLIKSEMYKIGEACSACPLGTSCSTEFPGLCSGVPSEPLTVRPPVDVDIGPFPTPKPDPDSPVQIGIVTVDLPTILAHPPRPLPGSVDSCVYSCQENGGCSVRFESTNVFAGSVSGSCFPPSFGGKCSGTPDLCLDCIGECRGYKGKRLNVTLDEEGNPGEPEITALPQEASQPLQGNGGSSDGGNTCTYSCKDHGGCSVKINSSGFISGSVRGSCFSPSFGGSCSGTPKGCKECLKVCTEDTEPGDITLPVEN